MCNIFLVGVKCLGATNGAGLSLGGSFIRPALMWAIISADICGSAFTRGGASIVASFGSFDGITVVVASGSGGAFISGLAT